MSREDEVRAFNATKTGVKGLVDSGVTKVPRIFQIKDSNKSLIDDHHSRADVDVQLPVVDFEGMEDGRRGDIVRQIKEAADGWGFFQMVNHGVPLCAADEMLDSTKMFHEQPKEMKMGLYTNDMRQPVKLFNNGDLSAAKPLNWKDSIGFAYPDGQLDMELVPSVYRKALSHYVPHLMKLKEKLSKLLSEALGLESGYLAKLECMDGAHLVCHYYPPCPEPDLAFGTPKHSDPTFLTILLQDNIGGLQVLHQDQWVDVLPVKGALLANIGDMMQLITNDKFKSIQHRVLTNGVSPRVSVAAFFIPCSKYASGKIYEPIGDCLSSENPALYRGTSYTEYRAHLMSKGLDGVPPLPSFRL